LFDQNKTLGTEILGNYPILPFQNTNRISYHKLLRNCLNAYNLTESNGYNVLLSPNISKIFHIARLNDYHKRVEELKQLLNNTNSLLNITNITNIIENKTTKTL
jgi:hypothetical protein